MIPKDLVVIYKAFCLNVAQGRMNGALNGSQRLRKGAGYIRILSTNRNPRNCRIDKIAQYTKKPENMKRLAVTQTLEKTSVNAGVKQLQELK